MANKNKTLEENEPKSLKIMKINITQKEIQAIGNAWEEVNEKLECAFDETTTKELQEILKRLRAIERKYKKA